MRTHNTLLPVLELSSLSEQDVKNGLSPEKIKSPITIIFLCFALLICGKFASNISMTTQAKKAMTPIPTP